MVTGAPVTVALAGSRLEAELIVGLLRSHGVHAAAVTDDAGGQEPHGNLDAVHVDGVHVLVSRSDEHTARELLADVGATVRRQQRGHS